MITRRKSLCGLAASALGSSRSFAGPSSLPLELKPDLAQRFAADGTSGTFVASLIGSDAVVASDDIRSAKAILPASTFKIPNSIIALETGVVADPDRDVFKWDGVVRAYPDWNHDHTLRSAIAASVVPVYQEIARRIGRERMQKFVDTFDYGNRDISGPIDRFWLDGAMRISPLQQIRFLDRLWRRSLPVSERSQALTIDILPVTKVGDALIRAKSGLVGVDDKSPVAGVGASVGWLVGFAEKGTSRTVFATNLDINEPRHIASRMKLSQQLLSDVGAI
jgi:beta-lactamase class D